ncbi:hypothetical protein AOLI_G00152780, partial [Acnodon oligacanthus]
METSTPANADPAQTNMTAQKGGQICASVLLGNNIQGPVNVTINQGGQEVPSSNTSVVQAGGSPSAPAPTEDLITVYKQKLETKFSSINEGISQHGSS